MNNRRQIRWAVLLPLLCLVLPLSAQNQEKEDVLTKQVNRIGQALYYIQQFYLDTVDTSHMADKVIEMLMDQLDPHSAFIPADQVQAMNEPLEGNFDGIGVEFTIIHDTLVVVTPVAGGPSESVGIRADDRIVEVDGVPISSDTLTNDKVFKLLRGPKGTRVGLTVVRRDVAEPLSFEVVRDRIPIYSVDAAYEAAPGIMYVKISRFAASTMEEFIMAFKGLSDMPKGLVLDLQGNGGGFLGTALFLVEQFLEKDALMLYAEGANLPRRDEFASGKGFFQKTPVVVLIDENSASASEIVAGALQDWDRATIVGRRSFGKGLVQQAFHFEDGAEMRLTIARYHTPSGRVIQSPYKMGDKEDYYREIYDRYARGEYFSEDSIAQLPDSLAFKTLVKGRTVYGGGGIMPDIFVPADTTYFSDFYATLLRKGIITAFMNDYLDVNREKLAAQYTTFEAFDKKVSLEDVPFAELITYAATKNATPGEGDLAKSEAEIRLQLKALMARRLFDMVGYYRVVNPTSAVYQKALEVLTGQK